MCVCKLAQVNSFEMGRWSQYDEVSNLFRLTLSLFCSLGVTPQDDHRLPEGMKRIGYDADTSRYIFRDRDGSLWQGPEGSEYGEMNRGL